MVISFGLLRIDLSGSFEIVAGGGELAQRQLTVSAFQQEIGVVRVDFEAARAGRNRFFVLPD
jgi:hypothetical protein